MADPRDTAQAQTGTADDVQQLKDRIAELEDQLRSARAESRPDGMNRRGEEALKAVTGASAALNLLLAFPAFLTLRRWWRWWWR